MLCLLCASQVILFKLGRYPRAPSLSETSRTRGSDKTTNAFAASVQVRPLRVVLVRRCGGRGRGQAGTRRAAAARRVRDSEADPWYGPGPGPGLQVICGPVHSSSFVSTLAGSALVIASMLCLETLQE